MPFIAISLFLGYILPIIGPTYQLSPIFLFVIMLLSIIPLSYILGLAIACISAQTTPAVGSVLNATFGSALELILCFFALKEGLHDLVRGSIVGTILYCLLCLPGLAMIAGGIKYREQKFNQTAAGVGSVLLIVSIIGSPFLAFFFFF